MMNAAAICDVQVCSALASGLYLVMAGRPEMPIAVASAEQADEIS